MNRSIFDRGLYKLHRDRSKGCKLFDYASEDIDQRLAILGKNFENILDIGSRQGQLYMHLKDRYPAAEILITEISPVLISKISALYKFCVDEEAMTLSENCFDLITFSMGLHAINDVPIFLSKIRSYLLDNGILIGNFIGGVSFPNLRRKFIELEDSDNSYTSRFMPMIRFDHVAPLLQQAGFGDIVTDYDKIEFQHQNAIEALHDIKRVGEASILKTPSNYGITKNLFNKLKSLEQFTDSLELISFTASKNKGGVNNANL